MQTTYYVITKIRSLPIRTEKKNCVIGTSKIGDVMFRNQLGDMGNNLKNNKKKNRLSRFSLT